MAHRSPYAGYDPNNLPHDDKRELILLSIWILAGLSAAFLIARIVCKLTAHRHLWWDDYIMIISWMTYILSNSLISCSVAHGEGLHVWDVDPANFAAINFLGRLSGSLAILSAVWSKTSFAVTLVRLISTPRSRMLLFFVIGSMNLFMTLNIIFLWVRCMPIRKLWNPDVPGTCWHPKVYPIYGIFAAGYSSLMDIVLALFPWKIVWRLQMERREKFGVAIAMSLGLVAGATGIVKTTLIPTLGLPDFSYASVPLIIWGAAEAGVTIMAASLPVLRVLLRDVSLRSRRHYRVSTSAGDFHGSQASRGSKTKSQDSKQMAAADRDNGGNRDSRNVGHNGNEELGMMPITTTAVEGGIRFPPKVWKSEMHRGMECVPDDERALRISSNPGSLSDQPGVGSSR
ncbi:integral membrane protein [Ophiostoma piceae UAMH 11346]|uniref:Integral membrane protein n=1 Tax=Ophiostoma piceae (strain UAMH 11346) TaxID=1262450 RepID=S3D7J4_OPHP1|nr:integral membrane protein [Ophiostoma piceae UAMH 11346]